MKQVMFMIESMIVGGAEKALINLVNNLDKEKYDITVISMYKYSVYDGYEHNFKELFNKNIKVKYLLDNSKKFNYKLFNFLYNKLPKTWFYKLFIKEEYDIEVAFYEGFPTTFLAHSTNKNSKKIAWLHTDSNNAFGNFNEIQLNETKDIYERFDLVVGVAKSVCDSFENIFGLKDKLKVQYNIFENNKIITKSKEYIDENLKNNKFKLISVGRLIPIKGYERLLKCIKKLKEDNLEFELWIVGDGSEKSKLEKYIIENDLNDVVKLLGFQDNPYKYIIECDLFVCSSLAEGFSTVVAEAIILGKAIITTRCSGMDELVGEDNCGLITENNEESLYNGLKKILTNNTLYEELTNNSKKKAKFFEVENRINEIETLL